MKNSVTVVCHHEYGKPEEVVRVERWSLPDIKPNEVLVLMKAAPVNPADLNAMEGTYAVRHPLPSVLGNEGVGVVAQAGIAVSELRAGQLVVAPFRSGNWCEAYVAPAKDLIAIPPGIETEVAATLSVNLATAWRMLEDFIRLNRGDWLLQNAGNSCVGRYVIQLARQRWLKTISVVRRPELAEELKALGATEVVTDGDSLAEAVQTITGGAGVQLALNAVGGKSARDLAKALSPHGTLVTYGAMSREPLQMGNGLLIFKDIHFRGFWINDWYRRASDKEIHEMYAQLLPLVKAGHLKVAVEKTYPLEQAREAVLQATRGSRAGKILFTMN